MIRAAGPSAGRFSGAGIVLVAGGPRYYTCAWVCLSMLRQVLGCQLPIQLWYLGPDEMSARMLELLERFEVECVDALAVRRQHPVRRLGGWECKPYAILHSRFEKVIYLDADNVPLVDPTFLLSHPEFRRTGAIFWPDWTRLSPQAAIWEICRVPYRDEPEVESGQLVLDKQRCWTALQLTMHLNKWSDFNYQHVLGDKETFHLAWRRLDLPYSMPPHPPRQMLSRFGPDDAYVTRILEQHDFDGRAIFHHRTGGAKWNAWGRSFQVPGFAYETACLEALRQLRARWNGRVAPAPRPTAVVASEADCARVRRFAYCRLGSDQRVLELLPDHTVDAGQGLDERTWRFEQHRGDRALIIAGDFGPTCRLAPDPDGVWRGRWLHYEQMPVELIPLGPGESAD